MAEGEGFEPPEPFGSTVFKAAAFNHSANPPGFFSPETFSVRSKTHTAFSRLETREIYFFFAREGLTGVDFTSSTICAVTSGFALR